MKTDISKKWLDDIDRRKTLIESGGILSIPFPIKELRPYFSGVQQGQYIGITASTKVGKICIYNKLFLSL